MQVVNKQPITSNYSYIIYYIMLQVYFKNTVTIVLFVLTCFFLLISTLLY